MTHHQILDAHNEGINVDQPTICAIERGRKSKLFTLWRKSVSGKWNFVQSLSADATQAAKKAIELAPNALIMWETAETVKARALPYDCFAFGKYKGQKILDVLTIDAKYCVWFLMKAREKETAENNAWEQFRGANQQQVNQHLVNIGLYPLSKSDRYVLTPDVSAAIWAAWEKAQPVKPETQHIGTLGERIRGLAVKVVKTYSFHTQFGTSWIITMKDANGNVVVYKGSNCIGFEDDELVIDATIASHDEYKGQKQTLISRPKIK